MNRFAAHLLRMPEHDPADADPWRAPTHVRVVKNGESLEEDALPVRRAARGDVVHDEEVDHVFDDGTVMHTRVSAHPLRDGSGRLRGAMAILLDITALRNIESALREANRHKDEFLAILSHELRNPLAPLRTAVALLGDALRDPARLGAMRDMMERQIRHLARSRIRVRASPPTSSRASSRSSTVRRRASGSGCRWLVVWSSCMAAGSSRRARGWGAGVISSYGSRWPSTPPPRAALGQGPRDGGP